MTDDRQTRRWRDARRRHHEATQHHREAVAELDAAAAELVTAGAALSERVQLAHHAPPSTASQLNRAA